MASQSYLASLANSAAAKRLTVLSDFIGIGSRALPAVGAAVTANQVYNAVKNSTSISDLYQNVMSPFVDISQSAQNGVQAVSSYLDKFGNWLNNTDSSVTPSIPASVPYPITTPKASIPTPAHPTAPISPVTPAKSPVTNYPSALTDGASLMDVIAQNGKILQGGISGDVGLVASLASIAGVLGSGVQVQYDALSGIGASLASLIPPLQLIAPAIESAGSPTITVPTPTVNVAAPSVTVQPPSVTIENKAPAITVPTPEVSITNQVSTPTIENSIDFTPVIGALGSIADSLPDVETWGKLNLAHLEHFDYLSTPQEVAPVIDAPTYKIAPREATFSKDVAADVAHSDSINHKFKDDDFNFSDWISAPSLPFMGIWSGVSATSSSFGVEMPTLDTSSIAGLFDNLELFENKF